MSAHSQENFIGGPGMTNLHFHVLHRPLNGPQEHVFDDDGDVGPIASPNRRSQDVAGVTTPNMHQPSNGKKGAK
jgi:hypothetical protein